MNVSKRRHRPGWNQEINRPPIAAPFLVGGADPGQQTTTYQHVPELMREGEALDCDGLATTEQHGRVRHGDAQSSGGEIDLRGGHPQPRCEGEYVKGSG